MSSVFSEYRLVSRIVDGRREFSLIPIGNRKEAVHGISLTEALLFETLKETRRANGFSVLDEPE